jgi:hypothetical protein
MDWLGSHWFPIIVIVLLIACLDSLRVIAHAARIYIQKEDAAAAAYGEAEASVYRKQ